MAEAKKRVDRAPVGSDRARVLLNPTYPGSLTTRVRVRGKPISASWPALRRAYPVHSCRIVVEIDSVPANSPLKMLGDLRLAVHLGTGPSAQTTQPTPDGESAAPQGRIIGVAKGTATERPSGQEAADKGPPSIDAD